MAQPVVTLHPLLVISITDHFTRAASASSSAPALPIGGLLFGHPGEVVNSLEVSIAPSREGGWAFDEETLTCWIERVGA
jgi:hypothetical protein